MLSLAKNLFNYFVKFSWKQWDYYQFNAFRLRNADKFAGFISIPYQPFCEIPLKNCSNL